MRSVIVIALLFAAFASWSFAEDEPIPPKDALWTIHCRDFTGANRAAEAKRLRELMTKNSGLKPWFVVHQSDRSTLFFGFYRSTLLDAEDSKDRKDAQRAHEEIKRLRAMEDEDRNKVFAGTFFTQIPQAGSEGPPEWDLRNTPPDRFWSLLVGVYKDNPDRRAFAVAAVKALRDEKVEAYYLHDEAASLVFVGAWPRGAIKEQESSEAKPTSNDPNVEIVVINRPLPKNMPREFVKPDGTKVRVFAPNIEVLDPSMEHAMDRNPYFMTNGKVMGREVKNAETGKKELLPNRSSLFIIPRNTADQARGGPPEEAVRQIAPTGPRRPAGTGSLKKLDD